MLIYERNEMKRVLMVLTTSFSKSGIGNVVRNYTSALHDLVHFDFFLCRGIDEDNKKYVDTINGKIIIPKSNREKDPIGYVKEFVSLTKNNNYDAVHIHGNSCTMFFDAFASRVAGIKNIIAHSHSTYTDYPFLHLFLKPFLNLFISTGLACSDEAGKWCFYKYSILNNAIDTRRFEFSLEDRNKLREQLDLNNKEFVLLSVGHLDKGKNQSYIIKLVSRLKNEFGYNFKLYIVGQGNLKNALNEQIMSNDLCDNVYLIGESSSVEQFYSMSDCFVFPSLYEGLGIVLIEAQASGLHCLASQEVPELSNVCGNVKYIPLQDEDSWINELIYLFNHRFETDRLNESKICCEVIEKKGYDITSSAKELINYYS